MQNDIAFINNKQGEWVEAHEEMEQQFKGYFQDILKDPLGSRTLAIQSITQHIPKIITDDHKKTLLLPMSMQEVEDVIAQLKDGKGLGPDGFTTNFFHAFWEHIKTEVWEFLEEVRSTH